MNRYRSRRLAILVFGCLLVGAWRLGEGRLFRHRGEKEEREAAVAALALPPVVGRWQGEEVAVDPREQQSAGAWKMVRRRYRASDTDVVFEVTFLVGPAGPIAVHPPTVCLPSAGWRLEGSVEVVTAGEPILGRFHLGRFVYADLATGVEGRAMLLWAWSDGSRWDVPPNPRWTYAGRPMLWKLYIGAVTGRTEVTREAELKDFLSQIVHALSLVALRRTGRA